MALNLIGFVASKKFNFEEIVKEFLIINDLKQIDQNPIYHGEGNVFIHTKKVCEEVLKLQQWNELSYEEKGILFLAALFHDIGKLTCTKIEDDKIVSPNHAVKGTRKFRRLFYVDYSKKFSITFNQREKIAALIKYHGLPLFFLRRDNIEFQLIKAAESVDMKLLYLLSKCDLLGRVADDIESLLSNIELFKEHSKEIGCYYSPINFANRYTRSLYFNKEKLWYGDEVFDKTTFEVIVMSGMPLSGKDSYIEEHFRHMPVISLDDVREEYKISPREGSAKVASIAREKAKTYLRAKQSFVWNATNTVRETRASLFNLFSAYGARVKFIYIEVPYEELILRNEIRERLVPKKIIDKIIDKLEVVEKWEGYEVEYIIS
ncbi:MAG: AAA family ATPase [Clostridiaceae bacterium]